MELLEKFYNKMNKSKLTKLYLVPPSTLDSIIKKPIRKIKKHETEKNVDHYSKWKNKQTGIKMKTLLKSDKNKENVKSIQNYLIDLMKNLKSKQKNAASSKRNNETQTDPTEYSHNFSQTSENNTNEKDFLNNFSMIESAEINSEPSIDLDKPDTSHKLNDSLAHVSLMDTVDEEGEEGISKTPKKDIIMTPLKMMSSKMLRSRKIRPVNSQITPLANKNVKRKRKGPSFVYMSPSVLKQKKLMKEILESKFTKNREAKLKALNNLKKLRPNKVNLPKDIAEEIRNWKIL